MREESYASVANEFSFSFPLSVLNLHTEVSEIKVLFSIDNKIGNRIFIPQIQNCSRLNGITLIIDDELEMYNNIKQGRKELISSYFKKYPNGKYSDEIKLLDKK